MRAVGLILKVGLSRIKYSERLLEHALRSPHAEVQIAAAGNCGWHRAELFRNVFNNDVIRKAITTDLSKEEKYPDKIERLRRLDLLLMMNKNYKRNLDLTYEVALLHHHLYRKRDSTVHELTYAELIEHVKILLSGETQTFEKEKTLNIIAENMGKYNAGYNHMRGLCSLFFWELIKDLKTNEKIMILKNITSEDILHFGCFCPRNGFYKEFEKKIIEDGKITDVEKKELQKIMNEIDSVYDYRRFWRELKEKEEAHKKWVKEQEAEQRRRNYYDSCDRTIGCFLFGTPIDTPFGSIQIERLAQGDMILAFENERTVDSTVISLEKATCEYYFRIEAGTRSVCATSEHPFYIGDEKFLEAKNLKPHDIVYTIPMQGGRMERIEITTIEKVEARVDVYNLRTDAPHTFFAGGFAVHNKGG